MAYHDFSKSGGSRLRSHSSLTSDLAVIAFDFLVLCSLDLDFILVSQIGISSQDKFLDPGVDRISIA